MKRINVITLKQIRERTVLYQTKTVRSPADAAGIIHTVFDPESETVEIFGILVLDTKNNVIAAHQVSRGTINAAIVHPREVFKAAILANGASLIAFHNHPSGDMTPSPEDLQLTERLVDAGKIIGIDVLDHIITGYGGQYKSLKELGEM